MKLLFKAISYGKHLWPYYLIATITALLVALISLAIPFVIKNATDLMVRVVQGSNVDITGAAILAGWLLGLDIAGTLIRNYGGYIGDVMSQKLKAQLSTRYYEQLLRLPQSYYDGEMTGTIINRLNRAITEITNFINMFANNFFQMLLTSILTIVIVARYSVELALMVAILYPVFTWLTMLTSKKWQRLQEKKNLVTDLASGRFAEVVTQIKVVKSYVQEKLEHRRFRRQFHETISLTRAQSKYWHGMDIARGLVLSVIFFGIYLFIFTQTVQKRFTIGEMVLLMTLINSIRLPIFSMSFIIDQFQRALTGSKDFVTAMELKPAITDRSGARHIEVTDGTVEFKSVDFSYNQKQAVLTDISFKIKKGEKVALVGESGEGKTTISNLLLRLYEPTKGVILIDGADICLATQNSLRQAIAAVFQEPALFSGTIRENIAYARPRATHDEIVAAAQSANAHDFIIKLKNGYDSEIGERGIKLSGGQKQRLAIARAILKDAPILILDEATSSLDSRAEHQVQSALDNLMKDRTTLIIAHRLSTIAHVDTIVTLKGGRVDEVGTPSKLAKTGGLYAQLLELQTGSSEAARQKLRSFEIKG